MSAEHVDSAADADDTRETAVGGDEGRVERLGERNVGGVVWRQVVPELPAASEQRKVRRAPEWQLDEIPALADARLARRAGGDPALKHFDSLRWPRAVAGHRARLQSLENRVCVGADVAV
jgi:hypothetical protein